MAPWVVIWGIMVNPVHVLGGKVFAFLCPEVVKIVRISTISVY